MDNEKKYLDKSGLTEYHEKIKEYINTEDDKKLGATISYDDYMALPEEERNVGNYYIPDYPMDTQVVIVDGKIGEKITLRRFQRVELTGGQDIGIYQHANKKYASIVLFDKATDETLKKMFVKDYYQLFVAVDEKDTILGMLSTFLKYQIAKTINPTHISMRIKNLFIMNSAI